MERSLNMTNAEIEVLLSELEEYADEIRGDWSCFDGRDLQRFVGNWTTRVREVITKDE